MHIWLTHELRQTKIIKLTIIDDDAIERAMYTPWQSFIAGVWSLRVEDEGITWHRTPEAAERRMNDMRDAYLAKLRASISKYEAITYTAQRAK